MLTRLRGVSTAAIIVLIAVNGIEVAFFLVARRARVYAHDSYIARPSGYLLDGNFRGQRSLASRCYLIRVYSKECPLCKADIDKYRILAHRAQTLGCRAISIAPTAEDADRDGDSSVIRLQYVDMAFGRALMPFLTPQTMLLDSRGRVVWSRVGTLDGTALLAGERALADP